MYFCPLCRYAYILQHSLQWFIALVLHLFSPISLSINHNSNSNQSNILWIRNMVPNITWIPLISYKIVFAKRRKHAYAKIKFLTHMPILDRYKSSFWVFFFRLVGSYDQRSENFESDQYLVIIDVINAIQSLKIGKGRI